MPSFPSFSTQRRWSVFTCNCLLRFNFTSPLGCKTCKCICLSISFHLLYNDIFQSCSQEGQLSFPRCILAWSYLMSTNPRKRHWQKKHQSEKRKKLGVISKLRKRKNSLTFLSLLNLNWLNRIVKGLQFGTIPAKDGSSQLNTVFGCELSACNMTEILQDDIVHPQLGTLRENQVMIQIDIFHKRDMNQINNRCDDLPKWGGNA